MTLTHMFLTDFVLLFDPCTAFPGGLSHHKAERCTKCFVQILCWFSLVLVASLFSVNSGEGNFVFLPNTESSFLLSSSPGKQPKRVEK